MQDEIDSAKLLPKAQKSSVESQPSRISHLLEAVLAPNVPLYTLPDLKEHLRVFKNLCELSRDYVIATGLMPEVYSESVWLNTALGHIYDTRTTSSTYSSWFDGTGLVDLAKKESSALEAYPGLSSLKPFNWIRYFEDDQLRKHEACSLEQASFLDWLTAAEATQIEAIRKDIYKTQLQILQTLYESIDQTYSHELLERCLNHVDNNLNWEDSAFLIDMSQKYDGGFSANTRSFEKSPSLNPGGLVSLLEVAAHVENEIREGTFHSLASAIHGSKLVADDYLPDAYEIEHYLISASDSEKIQNGLEVFGEKWKADQEFWRSVNDRFKHWLKPEYRARITIKVIPRYEKILRELLNRTNEEITQKLDKGIPFANVEEGVKLPWYQISDGFTIFGVRVVLKNSQEENILELLCKAEGQIVPIEDIDACAKSSSEKAKHNNRAVVAILKAKLQQAFRLPKFSKVIVNKRAVGYRLDCNLLRDAAFRSSDDSTS